MIWCFWLDAQICCVLQYTRAASEQDEKAKKAQAIKQGGLDNLLSSLEQARKVNVLDKSRMDWGQFKTANTKVCCHAVRRIHCNFPCLLFQERRLPHCYNVLNVDSACCGCVLHDLVTHVIKW